jgi:vacuolar protein sorting-associated protein 26
MNYLKSFYSSPPSLSIKLNKNKHNFFQYISKENKIFLYPTYFDNDIISGEIELNLNDNKSIIVNSLSIYLIGILHNEKINLSEIIFQDTLELLGQTKRIEIINKITKFNFCFQPTSKPYETYIGESTQIRYYLNVVGNIITDEEFSKIEKKVEICCLKPVPKKICDEFYLNKENNKNININIGIENVIHVNIKLLKSNYCMDDEIVGKIKIVKSELKLNGIFLEIKKEEKIYLENKELVNTENMARYELAEGFPEEGDEIYFRYYLTGVKNLTPSYKNNNDDKDKNNKFEVKNFLTFEFNDDTGYQFFKNIEIAIYRMNLANILPKGEDKNEKENTGEKFISIKSQLKNK